MELRRFPILLTILLSVIFTALFLSINAQDNKDSTNKVKKDSSKKVQHYRNIIRYDLSGAVVFGINRYVVFGYERLVGKNQSFSFNIGKVGLPNFFNIVTDSFSLSKNSSSGGFNVSADYRFYLKKENRYDPPHGLYIGPYLSFNRFTRASDWDYRNSSAHNTLHTDTDFKITAFGIEMGYQFIIWNRLALDLLLIGPGCAYYDYKATFDPNIDQATQEQLAQALKQSLTQKFPGMDFVFAGQSIDASGAMRKWNVGFRYIVHIGYNF